MNLNKIQSEYNRMSIIRHRNARIYEDEYIYRILAQRYSISIQKIKELTTTAPQEQEHQPQEQEQEQKRVCKNCGADVSHRYRNVIFCDRKCKDKYRYQKRKNAKK